MSGPTGTGISGTSATRRVVDASRTSARVSPKMTAFAAAVGPKLRPVMVSSSPILARVGEIDSSSGRARTRWVRYAPAARAATAIAATPPYNGSREPPPPRVEARAAARGSGDGSGRRAGRDAAGGVGLGRGGRRGRRRLRGCAGAGFGDAGAGAAGFAMTAAGEARPAQQSAPVRATASGAPRVEARRRGGHGRGRDGLGRRGHNRRRRRGDRLRRRRGRRAGGGQASGPGAGFGAGAGDRSIGSESATKNPSSSTSVGSGHRSRRSAPRPEKAARRRRRPPAPRLGGRRRGGGPGPGDRGGGVLTGERVVVGHHEPVGKGRTLLDEELDRRLGPAPTPPRSGRRAFEGATMRHWTMTLAPSPGGPSQSTSPSRSVREAVTRSSLTKIPRGPPASRTCAPEASTVTRAWSGLTPGRFSWR